MPLPVAIELVGASFDVWRQILNAAGWHCVGDEAALLAILADSLEAIEAIFVVMDFMASEGAAPACAGAEIAWDAH
jgi:hypothetical protein